MPEWPPTHNMRIEIMPHHHIYGLGYFRVEGRRYLWDGVRAYSSLVAPRVSDGRQGMSAVRVPGSTPFVGRGRLFSAWRRVGRCSSSGGMG